MLSKRPASGDWSVVENVRHLVFAEQAHLGEFLRDGTTWNPVRLSELGKAFAVKGGVIVIRRDGRQLVPECVGVESEGDLQDAFRAWDLIHRPIRRALQAAGEDAEYAMERHLQHLNRHVGTIEKLVAGASKDP